MQRLSVSKTGGRFVMFTESTPSLPIISTFFIISYYFLFIIYYVALCQ